MNLSPFAYDLVEDEFNYTTRDRADYGVYFENGVAVSESRRTGSKHAANTKLYSCECIFRQTYMLPCRHIMFWRLQNLSETVLPPYKSISERCMRGCPINDISVGDVGEGDAIHRTIQRVHQPKSLRGDDKYSKAKQQMEKVVSALSVQGTPIFNAAMESLDGFAPALQEGTFAEFAACFSPRELTVIKMEPNQVSATTTTSEATTPKKSNIPTSAKQVSKKPPPPTSKPHSTQDQQPPRQDKQPAATSFTFSPPPRSPGLS